MVAAYQQLLDPLRDSLGWSRFFSTVFAALPVVALFWLLVPRRWPAPRAAAAGALTAIVVAVFVYRMPALMAIMAFCHGAAFGLMPVGWTIFNTMLLYNLTVETGQFSIVRRSIAGLSADARIQAILIGFAFGAFVEGAAGGGTPVAICGAILVGLGFEPFLAAVLCLIANTSPVAFGGLSTPLITLAGVTGLRTETLSVMAGHQLPLLSLFVPLYMTRCLCSWKRTWEVWPALLVSGGSFSLFQFTFATLHYHVPGAVPLYPMTDIGGGIFSLVLTALFLRFWQPKAEWRFGVESSTNRLAEADNNSLGANKARSRLGQPESALTRWSISLGWAPYAVMSVLLLLTGLVRQREGSGPVYLGPVRTNYLVSIPGLNYQSYRDPRLHPVKAEQAAGLLLASDNPLTGTINGLVALRLAPRAEKAEFDLAWLTAPGTAVFLAVLLSALMLRLNATQLRRALARTVLQMRIPIPTIACMLGLSYVTRYAGMDATLGLAFAGTGVFYPFFAAILGWLGVFLTGTDAGSNALFGSLQKITATEIHNAGVLNQLSLDQAQVLLCTSNSTGGVMGKMIDAQSICVATAATYQVGREADIFKAVIWHSIILASVVGLITALQAYVYPFTLLVPK
jgi:lactate permease